MLFTILAMEWAHPPNPGHAGDVGDGTWGGTNPALPWGWKGGTKDSGVYDNVLPDAENHVWKETTVPVDPNEYQNEWLGKVVNIY
mmetsp:Transcript_46315/g.122736  ORF Transcript_46315/g.122736 Transcript_46315/m.122736 type:complete len:85 (+) Transcript_46315:34-288(+)|eukprot:CAMPEP_0113662152 /NCGR_PEP_ID=MMETSP0038_2-20120614/403_1 /TAXON_ID=2898 /ORGANISM="Cryptomonas paramecium" /LENGTH=84 /DNA_ID=CAMNT_0000576987 /DNA_START=15 /DNA_END=269 /DNA_ORIENTATION=+ /assembly_acc=CAM_ASM_000170